MNEYMLTMKGNYKAWDAISADEKQRVATSDVPPNIGKIDKRKTKSESLSNNKRVTVLALVPVASTGDQP